MTDVTNRPTQLQWGRGHVAAETGVTGATINLLNLLQWGRGHVAAETSQFSPTFHTRRRFNGAAATSPRKLLRFLVA